MPHASACMLQICGLQGKGVRHLLLCPTQCHMSLLCKPQVGVLQDRHASCPLPCTAWQYACMRWLLGLNLQQLAKQGHRVLAKKLPLSLLFKILEGGGSFPCWPIGQCQERAPEIRRTPDSTSIPGNPNLQNHLGKAKNKTTDNICLFPDNV